MPRQIQISYVDGWLRHADNWQHACKARCMKSLLKIATLAFGLGLALGASAQTAGQDLKNAGHDTKEAAKDTAHATAKGTRTAARKTKNGVKKGAHAVASETEKGADKVEQKTQ